MKNTDQRKTPSFISKLASSCLAFSLLAAIPAAQAMDSIVESVANGCKDELLAYCGEVVPGQGRVLACLYAHGDKLSGQCEYALYDAAAQLDRFLSALTYLANECDADLETHCSQVAAGEGRLAQCLIDNKADLQPRCVDAMEITNLKAE